MEFILGGLALMVHGLVIYQNQRLLGYFRESNAEYQRQAVLAGQQVFILQGELARAQTELNAVPRAALGAPSVGPQSVPSVGPQVGSSVGAPPWSAVTPPAKPLAQSDVFPPLVQNPLSSPADSWRTSDVSGAYRGGSDSVIVDDPDGKNFPPTIAEGFPQVDPGRLGLAGR